MGNNSYLYNNTRAPNNFSSFTSTVNFAKASPFAEFFVIVYPDRSKGSDVHCTMLELVFCTWVHHSFQLRYRAWLASCNTIDKMKVRI